MERKIYISPNTKLYKSKLDNSSIYRFLFLFHESWLQAFEIVDMNILADKNNIYKTQYVEGEDDGEYEPDDEPLEDESILDDLPLEDPPLPSEENN